MKTNLNSFKVESKFEDRVNIFDSKVSERTNSEFDIKLLFRALSKDDFQKVICIDQVPEGNIQKFIQAPIEWIKSHKVNS